MKPTKFELDEIVDLKGTIKKINAIDFTKISFLLLRIVEKFQPKGDVVFDPDEEVKIIAGLHLNDKNELQSISKLCYLIFQQAIYHLMPTSSLKDELINLGLSEDSTSSFSEVWSNKRKDLMMKVRQTTFSSNQLASVDWSLSLVLAKDTLSSASDVKPSVTFDFGIADGNTLMSDNIVSMGFDHKRLYDFYKQLESIQQQFDMLTS